MARLNDTASIAKRPASDVEHSVSVRKIDNGHIVRSSTYNPGTGEYKCSEMFAKNPPKIGGMMAGSGSEGSDAAGSRGLAGTKKYLGD